MASIKDWEIFKIFDNSSHLYKVEIIDKAPNKFDKLLNDIDNSRIIKIIKIKRGYGYYGIIDNQYIAIIRHDIMGEIAIGRFSFSGSSSPYKIYFKNINQIIRAKNHKDIKEKIDIIVYG